MTPYEYTKSGKHLPKILRDFHSQKEIFKAIHSLYCKDEGADENPSWVQGQIYVIDWFLWFMVQRGYTLQKCKRKNVDFYDITEDVNKCNQTHAKILNDLFKQSKEAKINE